jgi:hypothetical protein
MKTQDYLIEVMGVLGCTLVALQDVESVLAECWLAFARREFIEGRERFVVDDLYNLLDRNESKTLGQLLSGMKRSGMFKKSFEVRFERFVRNRNRLIHRIFKERAYQSLDNQKILKRLHRFITSVFNDAIYFSRIFDAYLGASNEFLHNEGGDKARYINLLRHTMPKKEADRTLQELRKILQL